MTLNAMRKSVKMKTLFSHWSVDIVCAKKKLISWPNNNLKIGLRKLFAQSVKNPLSTISIFLRKYYTCKTKIKNKKLRKVKCSDVQNIKMRKSISFANKNRSICALFALEITFHMQVNWNFKMKIRYYKILNN